VVCKEAKKKLILEQGDILL